MRNILTKKQLREQGIYFSSRFKVVFHHFKKGIVAGAGDSRSRCMLCQEQENEGARAYCAQLNVQCSYTVQDPFLGDGAAHTGLGLFTSVGLMKTVPHSQPRSQPNPPLKFSSGVILGPAKLTNLTITHFPLHCTSQEF